MLYSMWGDDSERGHFRNVPHVHFVESNDPFDVPEVQAAAISGFEPASEAPVWCFLPAVWPSEDRLWVPDVRARSGSLSCDGGPSQRVPWTCVDYAEIEADTNHLLAECGIPPRPAGRIWLLKAPPAVAGLRWVLDHLAETADAVGLPFMASREFVAHTRSELVSLFSNR